MPQHGKDDMTAHRDAARHRAADAQLVELRLPQPHAHRKCVDEDEHARPSGIAGLQETERSSGGPFLPVFLFEGDATGVGDVFNILH